MDIASDPTQARSKARATAYRILAELPLSELRTYSDSLLPAERRDQIDVLDGLVEQAVRLSRYLSGRHRGLTHRQAVRLQNQGAAVIRRLLGYAKHRDDLHF